MSKIILIYFIMQIGNLFSQFAFFNDYQSSENIFIAGTIEIDNVFISCGVINGNAGTSQGVLTFVSSNGELIKRKYINNFFSVNFSSIIESSDGVIVSGKIADSGLANQKKCIWKFDFSGNIMWEIPFGNTTMLSNDNSTPALLNTSDGFIVLSSEFGGATSTDGSMTKFDYNGNIIWSKLFMNDLSELTNDVCIYGTTCSDGFVFILKSYYPSSLDNEYFILKIDFLGEELWRKNVTNLSMGNLDLNGNKNIIYTVNSTNENNLIALFCSEDINSRSHRIYIVKYDNNGILTNVSNLFEERDIDPYKLIINENDEMYLMGLDNTDFGTNTFLELFISKINSENKLEWEAKYGYKNSNELWSGGLLTSDGGTLVGGSKFRTTQPFGYDHFLVKTDCKGSVNWDFSSCLILTEQEITCFPNPTEDIIYFHYQNQDISKTIEIQLIDMIGNQIFVDKIENSNIVKLDLTRIASSVYHYKLIIDGNKIFTGKVLKY